MDARLQPIIAAFKKRLREENICCSREKEINYGYQIICTDGKIEGTINFYYGKKGLSVVFQGKDESFKKRLSAAVYGTALQDDEPCRTDDVHPAGISSWIGCDEAGKGDVFGPLVAAACLITAEEEKQLRSLGVCDSKLLNDAAAVKTGRKIRDLLADRCIVTVIMPQEYNDRYEQLRREKKNLNHLLGLLHGRNIEVLLSKYECPCIIVDKFGKEEYVLAALSEKAKKRQIIQVPKGERDIAVAAASVAARQAFIEAMASLASAYGIAFPKGAYAGISDAISEFRSRYGDEKLACVGKLHFRNFDFLR